MIINQVLQIKWKKKKKKKKPTTQNKKTKKEKRAQKEGKGDERKVCKKE